MNGVETRSRGTVNYAVIPVWTAPRGGAGQPRRRADQSRAPARPLSADLGRSRSFGPIDGRTRRGQTWPLSCASRSSRRPRRSVQAFSGIAERLSPPRAHTGSTSIDSLAPPASARSSSSLSPNGRAAAGGVVVHGGVDVVGEEVGLGDRDDQPGRSVAAHGHARDPVRRDRPVLELGGQLLLAGGEGRAGGAARAARGRVAPRHDVQHAVDGLVVEDLVERAEPGGGVLARHDPEAVAAQPRVATGTTLHHRRADVRPTGRLRARTPGEPVGQTGLADAGHAGHRHRRVAVPEQAGGPLGGLGERGERATGDGRADGCLAVSQR